ncbi:MAG: hypothetical protein ACLR2G_00875 [Phascolarctobacterium faecium]
MPKIKKTIFQPTVDINATVKAGPITGPKKEPFNKNELALPFSFLLTICGNRKSRINSPFHPYRTKIFTAAKENFPCHSSQRGIQITNTADSCNWCPNFSHHTT